MKKINLKKMKIITQKRKKDKKRNKRKQKNFWKKI